MKDKAAIYSGLVLFLGLALIPVWYNFGHRGSAGSPVLEIKTAKVPGKDRCVMPVEYMRTSHMTLLQSWRASVVRTGERTYTSPDGRKFRRSLTNTCLDCHSNRENFCDRCHAYAGVEPDCWDCHVTPHPEGR